MPDEYTSSSNGLKYQPTAFSEDSYRVGIFVADAPEFHQIFVRYILAFVANPAQLGHLRAKLIQVIARRSGYGALPAEKMAEIVWCVLSLASERYFAENAIYYGWTFEQVEQIKSAWFEIMALAFIDADREKIIEINKMNSWRDEFVNLHQRDEGPLSTCDLCTSKCLYHWDVFDLTSDPQIPYEFKDTLRTSKLSASEATSSYCWNLTVEWTRQGNIDFAYCLATHLIPSCSSLSDLSAEEQSLLAHTVRTGLNVRR
jgi:hypothetical protein